jgi:PAS domain S-box-containing protein
MTKRPTYEELEKRVQELKQLKSELKRTEEALRESEERYRQIFNIAPAGIYEVDFRSGKLIDANDAICEYSGYTKEELLSMNATDLLTKESQKKYVDRINRILNGETVSTNTEYDIYKKDGSIIRLSISNRFIYKGDDLVGATVIAQDTTERWKIEASLFESEERYKELFDYSLDCIYMHDFEGNFIDANPAALDLLGYARDEIKSLNFASFLKEDDLLEALNVSKEIVKNGVQENISEYELKKKNGDYVVVQAKGSLLYKNGKPYAIMGSARDVTKYKRAEEELRKSENRYRLLAENVSDIIWVRGMDMKLKYVSPSVEKVRGYTPEEAMAQSIEEVLTPESTKKANYLFSQMIQNKYDELTDQYLVELEHHCKNGQAIWLELRISWMYDRNGNRSGVLGISRDITERKKADEKLKKLHGELEKRVKKRTRDLAKANIELEEKTVNLQEANTAMKVLLKRREDDQREVEEKILANVNELIIPLIDTMKGTKLDERQSTWLEILETNLRDIISPFSRGMSSKYWRLTPIEFQVANFIKTGKTTKEIADLLHVASSTINTHRDNIRKKLGIKNKKINLKTYLSDLE